MAKQNKHGSGVARGLSCCCGLGLVQSVVLFICMGQTFMLVYLVRYHNLFQESVYDITSVTQNSVRQVIPGSSRDLSNSNQQIAVVRTSTYRGFPVKIESVDKNIDHTPAASKEVVLSILGSSVDTNFPDLRYREKENIRSQYPTIFQPLPSYGFLPEFKNPCWRGAPDSPHQQLQCLPYVYLLGQPKCGTSDIFERLKLHPYLRMPNRKEVRWFTRGEFMTGKMLHEGMEDEAEADNAGEPDGHGPGETLLGPGSDITTFTRAFMGLTREISGSEDLTVAKELITMDGGPHTLWWPTQSPDGAFLSWDVPAPQLLREIQPQAKFLITLDDPVKRMYSDYYFLEDNLKPVRPGGASNKSPQEFHDRVKAQTEQFDDCISTYFTQLRKEQTDQHLNFQASTYAEAVKDYLKPEYIKHFPLWFRSAQMCAHDRHHFAVGGHGRLAINLYILFIEKWIEHFSWDNFLVVRLEDYDNDSMPYMQRIFRFLDLPDPEEWKDILRAKVANEHRVHREPLLDETETLLRDFQRPYNTLLSKLLKDDGFLFECPIVNGVRITLRSRQIVDARSEQARLPPQHGQGQGQGHPHDQHRLQPGDMPGPLDESLFTNNNQRQQQFDSGAERGSLRGPKPPSLKLNPKAFDMTDLPQSTEEALQKERDDMAANNLDQGSAARQICVAAFTMDLAKLRFLLYDYGLDPNLIDEGDGHRNAFHCLATLYTMGEAHGKSHVFAELKGKETWLTTHFKPELDVKMASVMSRDIVDRLETDINKIAAWLHRAGTNINLQDGGGQTPLHLAAIGGELELARFFIDHGAELDIVNSEGRTALHFAAALGHAEICGLLVTAKANLDLEDHNGVTARAIITNPGPITAEEALKYVGLTQRPAKQINRLKQPELSPEDEKLGWSIGTGGWGPERLQGFEEDMECSNIDQYYADEIDGETIFRKYLAHNAPVLIRGLIGDWNVRELYKVDNLIEDHGELLVQVSDIPYAQKFGGGEQVDMKLREYIEEVRAHKLVGGKHPWYVFKGHPIPMAADRPDSLVKFEDCPLPKILQDGFHKAVPKGFVSENTPKDFRQMFVNAQWALGGEGTGAPIHFHNTAWAALVYGAKKWMIYPPHNMIMSNKQILDYFETDRLDFESRGIKPVTCVQTAGDVMIIPESWGHGVLNIQESIAVATEFKQSLWRPRPHVAVVMPSFENHGASRRGPPGDGGIPARPNRQRRGPPPGEMMPRGQKNGPRRPPPDRFLEEGN